MKYEAWTCDFCTAGCTFEVMEWCAKRHNLEAECGYDRDQPLALDSRGHPSPTGHFEFVQIKEKIRFQGKCPSSLAEHYQYLEDTMETKKP